MPPGRPLIVTLTGPESTGKTWLTGLLARRFDAPHSPESARAFVDALLARDPGASLSYATVDPIARGQVALEDAAEAEARPETLTPETFARVVRAVRATPDS